MNALHHNLIAPQSRQLINQNNHIALSIFSNRLFNESLKAKAVVPGEQPSLPHTQVAISTLFSDLSNCLGKARMFENIYNTLIINFMPVFVACKNALLGENTFAAFVQLTGKNYLKYATYSGKPGSNKMKRRPELYPIISFINNSERYSPYAIC